MYFIVKSCFSFKERQLFLYGNNAGGNLKKIEISKVLIKNRNMEDICFETLVY